MNLAPIRKNKTELVFVFYFIAAFLFAFISRDFYEEDSVTHFLMAKYSFNHPWLLVNIWARPVPTLFHSLPAQFGIYFSKFFQIIIGLITGIITFYLGERLGLKNKVIPLILLLFQPFFFLTSYNVLTEPFFALIFVLSLFFLYSGKNELSLLSLSFLPLTRPEGYLLFPLFLAFLAVNKKLRLIHPVLLFTGSFIWWLSGTLIHSNLSWFIHNFPWGGEQGYYGRGSLFDYVSLIPLVTSYIGLPFMIYGIYTCFNKKGWLLIISFIIFVLFYSFIWWQGFLRSSLCPRYFAGLAPVMAIIMAKGMEQLPKWVNKIVLFIFTIISLFIVNKYFPFTMHPDHETIKQVFEWYKENVEEEERLMCSYFYFYYIAGKDPFNYERYPLPDKQNTIQLPSGSVIIWDNNFMIRKINEDYLISLRLKEMADFSNTKGLRVKIFKVPIHK